MNTNWAMIANWFFTDQAVELSGFSIGLLPVLLHPNAMERPLSFLWQGCVSGVCCSFGARLIANYALPLECRPIFSLLALTFVANTMYRRFCRPTLPPRYNE